jgi:hypothetical protein
LLCQYENCKSFAIIDIEIEEDIEPKDYLFETIVAIANNPDVKELLEENAQNIINFDFNNKYVFRQLLLKNPQLSSSLIFSKPKLTTQYLEKTYNHGIELINIFGEEKFLEMLDSVKLTNTKLLEDLNSIIKNDKELSNSIEILSDSNYNESICFILWLLFLPIFAVTAVFGVIWNLNPDGIIWTILFYPPLTISCVLMIIVLHFYINVFDCIFNPY